MTDQGGALVDVVLTAGDTRLEDSSKHSSQLQAEAAGWTDAGIVGGVVTMLMDSDREAREFALKLLHKLPKAWLARHADVVDAIVAKLEDSDTGVRAGALSMLAKLRPATLAQHADAVVGMLEDSEMTLRKEAVVTLGKLEPAKLAEHAGAVVARLEDSDERVRARALDLLRGLPRYVSEHRVDIFDSRPVRSRLLGRLGWYRYRLRMRVRRLALYWYALPYRPSGPGHARDVEAWEQMNTEA